MKKITFIIFLVLTVFTQNTQAQFLKKLKDKVTNPSASNGKKKKLDMSDGAKFGFIANEGAIIKAYTEPYLSTKQDIYGEINTHRHFMDLLPEGTQVIKATAKYSSYITDSTRIRELEYMLVPYSIIQKPQGMTAGLYAIRLPISAPVKLNKYKDTRTETEEESKSGSVEVYYTGGKYENAELVLAQIAQKLPAAMQAEIKQNAPARKASYLAEVKAYEEAEARRKAEFERQKNAPKVEDKMITLYLINKGQSKERVQVMEPYGVKFSSELFKGSNTIKLKEGAKIYYKDNLVLTVTKSMNLSDQIVIY
jgi:hypothetical protein